MIPREISNIRHHEIIGCLVKVVDSTNKSLVGLEGEVVDETKNLLIVKSKGVTKKILKNNVILVITVPESGKKTTIRGDEISLQPEKRLKKQKRRKRRKRSPRKRKKSPRKKRSPQRKRKPSQQRRKKHQHPRKKHQKKK